MRVVPFELLKVEGNLYTFECSFEINHAGSFKTAVRMFPKNNKLPHRQDFCYVKWLD
jgi:starch phosphorylase